MSPERNQGQKDSLVASTVFRRILLPLSERVIDGVHLEFQDGKGTFIKEYLRAIETGHYPFEVSNHRSLADIFATCVVSEYLIKTANAVLPEDEKYSHAQMGVAASLLRGDQGPRQTAAKNYLASMLREHSVELLPYVRDRDVSRYEYIKQNAEILKRIRNGPRDRVITALYPEGGQDAGKQDENGVTPGMHLFEEGSAAGLIDTWQSSSTHANTVIVPYYIVGGDEVFNPTPGKLWPPKKNIARAINPFDSHNFLRVKIGLPIKAEELYWYLDPINGRPSNELVNNFIAFRISRLGPEAHEHRGVYTDTLMPRREEKKSE